MAMEARAATVSPSRSDPAWHHQLQDLHVQPWDALAAGTCGMGLHSQACRGISCSCATPSTVTPRHQCWASVLLHHKCKSEPGCN